MGNPTVMRTRELGLCLSCEICAAGCPEDAIAMEYLRGEFLPVVDYERCTGCGLCLAVCPGMDLDPFDLRHREYSDAMFDGPWLHVYTAHLNDLAIRKKSTSGGLVTGLVAELLNDRAFDGAFVLPFTSFTGQPARLRETADIDEVLQCAGSKYVPASVYEVIRTLREEGTSRKLIVVGTPCQIDGIRKYMRSRGLSQEAVLLLGLFCDRTLNFNIAGYFENAYAEQGEKLAALQFRTKEKHGWPGHSKLCFDSGREIIVDRSVRMQLKPFFQLRRCLFCTDKLNQGADISLGDCYVEGEGDFHGKSTVIVRTVKGKEVFDLYSHLFTLKEEGMETIRRTQGLAAKSDNLEWMRLMTRKHKLCPGIADHGRTGKAAVLRLAMQERLIGWGENRKFARIRAYLFTSRMAKRLRTAAKMALLGGMLGAAIVRELLRIRRPRPPMPATNTLGSIVIVGGGFRNKGAQAMLFTAVDQIRRRLPDRDVYLLSAEEGPAVDRDQDKYEFTILPYDIWTQLRLLGVPHRLLSALRGSRTSSEKQEHMRRVITGAGSFIDISGYGLSSQWGFINSISYLLNIMIAKKFSASYYVLPQSIGPFTYPPLQRVFLYPLLKLCLPYPRRIFVRENDGLEWVRKFSRKNVAHAYDIVLTNRGYDLNSIYACEVETMNVAIEPGSVAIIPNVKVLRETTSNAFNSVYCAIIQRLLAAGKTVYLLRHSYEDLGIIEELASFFSHDTAVKLVRDDISAIEFEMLVGRFDFIIGSRYHSIVHAYKNGVPALVIGWAGKYSELLGLFGQQDYCVDVRDNLATDMVVSKLDKLLEAHEYEHGVIVRSLAILESEDVFDVLGAT